MKLALAFIVALQVSVCLCEVHQPSKELVDKYEGLKAVFYKRLTKAFESAKETIVPFAEGTVTGDKAKEIVEYLKDQTGVQTAGKLAVALGKELEPLVDKARMAALGMYEEYLRSQVGEHVDKAIAAVKPVLDQWLPAEDH